MKRTIFFLSLAVACATTVSADKIGIAESKDTYSIIRSDEKIESNALEMLSIQDGDQLISTKAPIKVETLSGETVLIGEESDVTLTTTKAINFDKGTLAVATRGFSDTAVSFDNLEVKQMTVSESGPQGAGPASSRVFALKSSEQDQVSVGSVGSSVTITDKDSGEQLAVVGHDEIIELFRNEAGLWQSQRVPVVAQQDGAADGNAGAEGTDSDDDDEGAFWWWVGGGAGAAGLGLLGYSIYENSNDDDDDDDDDDDGGGGTFSPIGPGNNNNQ